MGFEITYNKLATVNLRAGWYEVVYAFTSPLSVTVVHPTDLRELGSKTLQQINGGSTRESMNGNKGSNKCCHNR
jgi:hypothetical protein